MFFNIIYKCISWCVCKLNNLAKEFSVYVACEIWTVLEVQQNYKSRKVVIYDVSRAGVFVTHVAVLLY